jgi:hypothetical protein
VYRVSDHHRAINDIIARIPSDAIVSTHQFLMPRLFRHRGAMMYPMLVSRDGLHRADYVLLDQTNNGPRNESPAFISGAEMDLVRGDPNRWEIVAARDDYVLYRLRP